VGDEQFSRRIEADHGLPFITDLIDHGDEVCANPEDIISVSNSDVGCIHGITGYILDRVRANGCAFAHRHDSAGRIDEPIISEATVRADLQWYPGSDWFWMTKAWWTAHRAEMPDMVLGREYWDAVLRQIMKRSGGQDIPFSVWHEKHPNGWEHPSLRETLPGNVHNRDLARAWFAHNGSDANDPFRSTWNLVPGVTVPADPTAYRATARAPRQGQHGIVLPLRLEFHQNPLRRPPIPS
jgi:hypothetical protein